MSKILSSLAQSVVDIEKDVANLEHLSSQLETLSVESESELSHTRKLLGKFGETGTRVADGVMTLSDSLNHLRERAEKAAQTVSSRAALVQLRQEKTDTMMARFTSIVEKVQKISAEMTSVRQTLDDDTSPEDKIRISQRMAGFDLFLIPLVEELRSLKLDARDAHLKSLERDADAMSQSLDAARKKLSAFHEASPQLN